MSKQPEQNGNLFADILMPFVVAGIFMAAVAYSVLKWMELL